MLAMLSRIFARKVSQATGEKSSRPAWPVPLGLTPGSVWSVPDLDVELARSDGSILQAPAGDLIVDCAGRASLFGLDVWHVRFVDHTCFLQAVTAAGNKDAIQQLRLFTLHDTIIPATSEEWEFWLGRPDWDAQGRSRHDATGAMILAESGLIGGPDFQIDGPPAIVYNRQWPSSGNRPVKFVEHAENQQGQPIIIIHEAMEYARRLKYASTATAEYLLATAHGSLGQVRIYIGIDLDAATQRVISLG